MANMKLVCKIVYYPVFDDDIVHLEYFPKPLMFSEIFLNTSFLGGFTYDVNYLGLSTGFGNDNLLLRSCGFNSRFERYEVNGVRSSFVSCVDLGEFPVMFVVCFKDLKSKERGGMIKMSLVDYGTTMYGSVVSAVSAKPV
ncbi:hypothetical protein CBL_00081 [Carabus blaptoides fortunei]